MHDDMVLVGIRVRLLITRRRTIRSKEHRGRCFNVLLPGSHVADEGFEGGSPWFLLVVGLVRACRFPRSPKLVQPAPSPLDMLLTGKAVGLANQAPASWPIKEMPIEEFCLVLVNDGRGQEEERRDSRFEDFVALGPDRIFLRGGELGRIPEPIAAQSQS